MGKQPHIVVIGGPTASGKSRFAVRVAHMLGCGIINADSRQIYSEIAIGTARPSEEEQAGIPHHLFGHKSIHDPYTVGIWQQEVDQLISSSTSPYWVVVGGTGLYLRSLIEGLDDLPKTTPETRQQVESLYQEKGIGALIDYLKQHDPVTLEHLDQNNHRRLMRPIEIHLQTGQTMAHLLASSTKPAKPYTTQLFLPQLEREVLYNRINLRVDIMMEMGLLEEVKTYASELGKIQALETVGYQEFAEYFHGEQSLEETLELIKRNTRRYAKRQGTFFKRLPGTEVDFAMTDEELKNLLFPRV